jgi:hypothetical protein
MKLATQSRPHNYMSLTDGATIQAINRHIAYRRFSSTGTRLRPLADDAAVQAINRHIVYRRRSSPRTRRQVHCRWNRSAGHNPSRPLLQALQSGPHANTSIDDRDVLQTTCLHGVGRWRRSLRNTSERPLEMAPQLRPQADTPLADDTAVQASRQHVHCGWHRR